MISLLEAAKPYISNFKGIRLSTRPDYIDDEILILLKKYNVTTIELGAQSMNDTVLNANNRGHNSDDVINSSNLIKSYGFNLGLQMMTGLYKSDYKSDLYTAEQFVKLKPDCVRIYPTVIIKNTELERLFLKGEYVPYSLKESVKLCSELITLFHKNDIDVIRVGLHYSDSLINNDIAKIYHPAFKELCESRIILNAIKDLIKNTDKKDLTVFVNPKSLSKAIGQNRANLKELKSSGYNIKFKTDNSLDKYEVKTGD
jgi:histone acetyltransferase (RNA polymerase elongator complex component)